MPAEGSAAGTDPRSAAMELLRSLDRLDFARSVVAGEYVRFDESARSTLKDFRSRVLEGLAGESRQPSNFLLWGAPGSGKTYLVQQVAALAAPGASLLEANLARLDAIGLQSALARVAEAPNDVVCLVDEVDAHAGESWPYELLLPALEPSVSPAHRIVYCLAGSGESDLARFARAITARPKGTDLLSRIPSTHRYTVPSLQPGDRLLVASSQMLAAAAVEGRALREVEALALFYLATAPELSSARQLRAIALESVRRMPTTEDRLRYDHLFAAGDPENKRFWAENPAARVALADRFVAVGGPTSARPEGTRATRAAERAVPATHADPASVRIAILPFANISADAADRYISEGLTEELIGAVSKLPGLHVIARTSVAKYSDGARGVADVARELGVASVIEGSVRRAGDALRVRAQLIDAETEAPAWSMTFDRKLENVFAIQEELALRIADSLHLRLFGDTAARLAKVPTRSLAAHEEYLLGRQSFYKSTDPELRKAIAHFERAIALDPSFALAHCGLGEAHAIQGNRGYVPLREALDQAEVCARRALQLDPSLAEAHAALAPVLFNRYDWLGTIRELDQALALDPSNVQAHFWRAVALGTVGRPEEGLANAERAVQLDPMNPRRQVILAQQYYWLRRFDEAAGLFAEAIRAGASDVHGMRAAALLLGGRPEEAIAEAEKASGDVGADAVWRRAELGQILARAGQPERARKLLQELREIDARTGAPAGGFACIEAALGDFDAAFADYAKARSERSMAGIGDLAIDPLLDPMRRDPRFPGLLRLFGFPDPATRAPGAP